MLKTKKKFILCSCFMITLILVFYYSITIDHLKDFYFEISKRNSIDIKHYSIDRHINYRIEDNNQWLVNKNLLQYSAYGIISQNSLKVEVLVHYSYVTVSRYFKRYFKCVIQVDDDYQFLVIQPNSQIEIVPNLIKFTCLYNKKVKQDAEVVVAVIYEPDFDLNLKSVDFNKKQVDTLPYDAIQFHRARLFNGDKPKKQAVAHCVHMMFGIDSVESREMLKFKNWIEMQKNIGIDQIRLYVFDLKKEITDHVSDKYGDFLKFIQHQTSNQNLCGWFEKQLSYSPNSVLVNNLYNYCNQSYKKFFNPIDIPTHDRICMNDCYLNFKYEYELFTNYDIDEIILPRINQMYNLNKFEPMTCDSSVNSYKPKYNIYNYGIDLINQFGRNQYACFMFKHVTYLPNDYQLGVFMKQLKTSLAMRKSAIIRYTERQNRSDIFHKFIRKDFLRGAQVYRYHKINECFRNKYVEDSKIAEEFQRYVAVYIGSRWGKSIIDTNLTETINHHSCDNPHRYKFDVELKYGYLSHYRTEMHGFLDGKIYPFDNIFTDIEYYLFLCNVFKQKVDSNK